MLTPFLPHANGHRRTACDAPDWAGFAFSHRMGET